jgi:hypothetical protein
MATKTITRGRDISYSPTETKKPSMVSSWLTGLMLLIIIALVASLLNSAAFLPKTGESINGPMVLPEGTPGMRLRDGNEDALDAIAGVPSGNGAASDGSIDSRISTPQTDRLPGRDDRKPQPVPAPL